MGLTDRGYSNILANWQTPLNEIQLGYVPGELAAFPSSAQGFGVSGIVFTSIGGMVLSDSCQVSR